MKYKYSPCVVLIFILDPIGLMIPDQLVRKETRLMIFNVDVVSLRFTGCNVFKEGLGFYHRLFGR